MTIFITMAILYGIVLITMFYAKKEDVLDKIGLLPRFTRASLFLTFLTSILVLATNSELSSELMSQVIKDEAGIVLFLYIVAVLASAYYAFSNKKIAGINEIILIFYALFTNLIANIEAYWYLSDAGNAKYIFLLSINVGISFFMLLLFALDIKFFMKSIEEKVFSKYSILLGVIIVIVIFLFSQYFLRNHWAVTFSICLVYALNISEFLNKLIFKKST